MKLSYFPETDTLYIELAPGVAADSLEIGEHVVADYDDERRLIGLEIEHAATRIDVTRLETDGLPIARLLAA